jgi:hypothetical protein
VLLRRSVRQRRAATSTPRCCVYVPELGGAYDPLNSTNYILMTIIGGIGRSERQVVQTRVRLGMGAQVEMQGRYQGGRPPFGYTVEPIGPHPNPRKAAEGYQLERLAPDPDTESVVRRIFAEYLSGKTLREIAVGLNADDVPCPYAHRPSRTPIPSRWPTSTTASISAAYHPESRSVEASATLQPQRMTVGGEAGVRGGT